MIGGDLGRKGKVCYSKVQEPEGKAEAEKRARKAGNQGHQILKATFKKLTWEGDGEEETKEPPMTTKCQSSKKKGRVETTESPLCLRL